MCKLGVERDGGQAVDQQMVLCRDGGGGQRVEAAENSVEVEN
jgi:hypothetical protein